MKIEKKIEEVVLEPFEPYIEVPYIVGTTTPTHISSLYKSACSSMKTALSCCSERMQQQRRLQEMYGNSILSYIFNDPSVIYIKKC